MAASILNLLEPRIETVVMQEITATDEALGNKIQDLMFVFDNLIEVDDRGMQELLRQVTSDKLLLAMKAADEALKEKIFKNMSQRAAEMLHDDLAAKGPVKLSDVEAAQKEILVIARKLAEEGAIQLGGKGGEDICLSAARRCRHAGAVGTACVKGPLVGPAGEAPAVPRARSRAARRPGQRGFESGRREGLAAGAAQLEARQRDSTRRSARSANCSHRWRARCEQLDDESSGRTRSARARDWRASSSRRELSLDPAR